MKAEMKYMMLIAGLIIQSASWMLQYTKDPKVIMGRKAYV